jgi:hypothetical protein
MIGRITRQGVLAMTIRPALLSLAAAAALAPASASARDRALGDTTERLSDPAAQMAASAAIAAMAETVLNIDIAPFARAVAAMGGGGDTLRDLPPDARLRDLAGPDAERMPREIARSVPRAMGSAAEMASAVQAMLPELRDTARRMRDALPRY